MEVCTQQSTLGQSGELHPMLRSLDRKCLLLLPQPGWTNSGSTVGAMCVHDNDQA